MPKYTVPDFAALRGKQKIVMLTAYDYAGAVMAEAAGVDLILVGDSLGMVVLGYESTVFVTMQDMIHHTRAVKRGARESFIVVDMPFGSVQTGLTDALRNAVHLIKETGADAVKIEGGEEVVEIIRHLSQSGIPVVGHVGLTPQTAVNLGGFKVQGKTVQDAQQILRDAQAVADAGAFMVVLEAIPAPLAQKITERLNIPTIGIGAGPHLDGQVLVYHDVLGFFDRFTPKFVKQYAQMSKLGTEALQQFVREVRTGVFPGPEHSFSMKEEVLSRLY
ncbi:3-methyl-2-oxobutanoate hydroxymethyltransferase [Deinococcus cellulosilyticus]|uniref:3-methyl-2-oxobutanoate hydroxymethyltransferase n=1 Tax=Deinococcus cellulosilyticus (strain DSM 18568 / NBRC 106333 / KACC 11606 / 5516J-15) TaxID=1223518 RepID=A0A511N6F2_DEIC1|nr:3-methyl-2-oxobutanoate hydroxymethyltransferase [Deinococcus cellulosilyticus]GEM48016.1 3-methyl-2-oxobutanoate hydroxymethyltransferase [Deinococcus cellulosilyticus NBRC 106333 = KACC 11606]